jgi:hypothetical protein
MGEAFARSARAFMANWGPKVTQLAPLTSLERKVGPITMTDPSGYPGHRSAHPRAAQLVSNTHEEQDPFKGESSL